MTDLTNLDRYERYTQGADANDRRVFDAVLIGWLLGLVDESTATRALEAAAATVNAPLPSTRAAS